MSKLLIVLLLHCVYAFGNAQGLYDGPYVLYNRERLLVKSIVNGRVFEKSAELLNKSSLKVSIDFPEREDWSFSVPLKSDFRFEPAVFRQPEKLLFVSDIEGEFDGFRRLLITNKVIDEKYHWKFGKGHLVICGDLFDRGTQVPECLWLLYKLEYLAEKAGGYVHVILGNHDVMNLSGDVRYVQPKYFEAAKLMGVDYMDLYGVNSELGRWLRSKNIVEKIGDNLCAHAGIAPEINRLGMSLEEINAACQPFYDQATASSTLSDPQIGRFFKSETSLFWYRGYFKEPKATEAEVDETLRLFDVKRIVVGHTIVPENIGFQYGGKVLGIDVDGHKGIHQAALYEQGKWWKVDDRGNKVTLK